MQPLRGKVEQFNDLTYVYLYISNVRSQFDFLFFRALLCVASFNQVLSKSFSTKGSSSLSD